MKGNASQFAPPNTSVTAIKERVLHLTTVLQVSMDMNQSISVSVKVNARMISNGSFTRRHVFKTAQTQTMKNTITNQSVMKSVQLASLVTTAKVPVFFPANVHKATTLSKQPMNASQNKNAKLSKVSTTWTNASSTVQPHQVPTSM
jgi:hypothetical protein